LHHDGRFERPIPFYQERQIVKFTDALPLARNNDFGIDGWKSIMDGLARVTSVTSLNDVHGVKTLFRGGCEEIDLSEKKLGVKEAVPAVAWLLQRSRGTLTKLDLRCSIRLPLLTRRLNKLYHET
jgi:hypothetical protein